MTIQHLSILLVVDDAVDVMTVKRAFKEGHIVNPLQVVSNGLQALQFLRHEGDFANQATERPRMILLDLNMPIMNGIEFLHVVKADDNLKTIPIVVLTTSKHERDLVESYQLGVAGYVLKPVDFLQFVEVVKTINLYWSLCQTI